MASRWITLRDLMVTKETYWPHVRFCDYQVAIAESWCRNRETVVVAGTELGKDFMAGFLAVATPLVCAAKGMTFKILTISASEKQLGVLWGEVGRFVRTAKVPLLWSRDNPGGPLVMDEMRLRLAEENENNNPFNYVRGFPYSTPETLQGHYADFNAVIGDEASALNDEAWKAVQPMKRFLWIGNANPCSNFFRRAVQGGDLHEADEPILVGGAR